MKRLIFALLLSAHCTCQFLSWAKAGAIRSSDLHIAWSILSAPLFYLLPKLIISRYFWVVATGNSFLWALVLTNVIARCVAMVAAGGSTARSATLSDG
jgi:hypothetical protein